MRIAHLRIDRLRRFAQAECRLHPRLNVFTGANAAGKTTVLEAAYIACRGQSFRARRMEEAIRSGETTASVVMEVAEQDDATPVRWSAGFQRGEVLVQRLDSQVTRREQAAALPLVLVDRSLHKVFEDAPIYRRRYVDWGLFYVEQKFFDCWRRYERALDQRNAGFRTSASPSAIRVWDAELIVQGERLQELRLRHVTELERALDEWLPSLLGGERVRFELRQGWDASLSLSDYLAERFTRDQQLGYTVGGPHRAELRVRFDGQDARAFVSRGQQKLLAVAMALAQAAVVLKHTSQAPLFVLDDVEAELSVEWQRRLVATLLRYPGQAIVTSLEWRSQAISPPGLASDDLAVFHVEQDKIVAGAASIKN